ncbi:MAG: O-antigen ligase family protein [Candidatus Hydrogenedentota bacterium]
MKFKLTNKKIIEGLLIYLIFAIPLFFMGITGFRNHSFDELQNGIFSVAGADQYLIKEVLGLIIVAIIFSVVGRSYIKRELFMILLSFLLACLTSYKTNNPEYIGKSMIIFIFSSGIILSSAFTLNKNKSVFALTISAIICASYGLLQYYGLEFVSYKSIVLTSSIGNKNLFAEFLTGVFPFCLYFIHKKRYLRLWGIISAVIILYTLYLCRTRSSFVGILAIITLYPLICLKNKKSLIVSLIVFVFVFLIMYLSLPTFKTIFQLKRGTNLVRLLIFKSTLDGIRENIFGAGIGSFPLLYPEYALANERELSGHLRVDNAHNDFLQYLVETGIFIFSLIISSIILSIMRAYNKKDEINRFAILSIVGIGATAMFGFPLHQYAAILIFSFSLGIITADHNADIYTKKTGILKMIIAFIVMAVLCTGAVVADISDYRGIYFEDNNMFDNALKEFNRAVSISKNNEVYNYRIGNCMKKVDINKYYQKIEFYFKRNIELFHTNIRNRGNLAEFYRDVGKNEKSAIEFKKVYYLDPLWDYGNINLCGVYNTMLKYEQSVELLFDARIKGFREPKLYENLGFTLFQLKRMKESARYYELLLKYDETPQNYKNLGVVYVYLGDYQKAKETFLHGLNKFPHSELLQNNLTQMMILVK